MTFSHDPAQLDRWNTRFSAEGYLFGKRPNAFLESQAHRLKPGMRALSVADGEGRNSVWLARQGLEVTAFDFSPVGVEKARALAREAGVQVDHHQSDIFSWPWQRAHYDVVAAIFIQFLTPEQRTEIFRRFRETLRPGGLLIVQGYRPEQLGYGTGGPPQVENLYTVELLHELLCEWEILHLASHDDVVDEGAGHSGMSALIDVVARR
ncbi:MAG TPA: class I SAM-dependent methyltransferase [Usitatibacter sp.]|nr:class I SAM-dependent methyltransferase [Usitatibacter sp.]